MDKISGTKGSTIMSFDCICKTKANIRTVEVFYAKQFPYLYFFCQDQQDNKLNTDFSTLNLGEMSHDY